MKPFIHRDAMRLTKYEELREILLELCYGDPASHPASVQIFGPPEVGKTQTVQSIFGSDNAVWAPAHLTAFTLYVSLYRHRNRTFIFDDPTTDDDRSITLELLMKVGERTPTKTLSWADTPQLRKEKAAPRFSTKSRVLSIANSVARNPASDALSSRTDTYLFEPTAETWLGYVRSYWPQDDRAQEVLKYVEENASSIQRFGCRMMDKALRASRGKRTHVPWQRYLEPMFGPSAAPAGEAAE